MDHIKYSVDEIEGDDVILQNIETLERRVVNKSQIDFDINGTDIIIYDGIKYYKDEIETENRINYLMEKMNKLRIEED